MMFPPLLLILWYSCVQNGFLNHKYDITTCIRTSDFQTELRDKLNRNNFPDTLFPIPEGLWRE